MSYSFTRFNKGNRFNINTEGFEYKSLKDLYEEDPEKVYTVRALYINTKGKYGDSPVYATDSFFINGPQHMTESAEKILADPEAIAAINDGHMGLKVYTYDKDGRELYSCEYVDL